MIRFLIKTGLFLIPILGLHLFTLLFYTNQEGDLTRLGFLPNQYPEYRSVFKSDMNRPTGFTPFSQQDKKAQYKVLTIGDSFSEQKGYGYNSYLGDKLDVLHIDRFQITNQVEALSGMLHGGFFDTYQVDFVVLQSVERTFLANVLTCDFEKVYPTPYIDSLIQALIPQDYGFHVEFLSDQVIKVPAYLIPYNFSEHYFFNELVNMHRLKSSDMFSNGSNRLLTYKDDMLSLEYNSDEKSVALLNDKLNGLAERLQQKGIELIVLPAPDKYDLYYPYIKDHNKLPEPRFFDIFSSLEKRYHLIDSRTLLRNTLEDTEDLYFYDDTHWSPKASRLIASEIVQVIAKADALNTSSDFTSH